MRIVHSWLTELAPVGDDIDMVAATMTDLGLVVEEIIQVGATVEGVITTSFPLPRLARRCLMGG